MKKLLLALVCLTSMAFCTTPVAERESHKYVTIGAIAPIPIPQVGIGYRFLEDNAGYDLSLDVGSFIVGYYTNAHCKYIEYIGNKYIALGVKATFVHVTFDGDKYKDVAFAPEITFGIDQEKTFHQVTLAMPHMSVDNGFQYVPVVAYQYGVKF